MSEFLKLLPPAEALSLFLKNIPQNIVKSEVIDTTSGLGRVAAEDIFSAENLPCFSRSTMDGYAVQAKDTFGASDNMPIYLSLVGEVPMGREPGFMIGDSQAALIHTGGMLPEGADAVVIIENTQVIRPGEIEITHSIAAGENLIFSGEDVKKGQVVIKRGKVIRPAEIGGLLALGILQFKAARQPTVGIISSGDEIINPEKFPEPGQVRDINSYSLTALARQSGAISRLYGIIPDWKEALFEALKSAHRECDLVVITAGSSASIRDMTADVIQNLGNPGVLVHGINIRPGKPTILAVCDNKPVIGLPGNPVSALLIANLFVKPVISKLLGVDQTVVQPTIQACLTTNIASQAGREDWVPVHLFTNSKGCYAEPIFYKSNLIFSLVQADGFLRIPSPSNGLSVGEVVHVFLF
jgi:molybdopterin molybdotransferase